MYSLFMIENLSGISERYSLLYEFLHDYDYAHSFSQ